MPGKIPPGPDACQTVAAEPAQPGAATAGRGGSQSAAAELRSAAQPDPNPGANAETDSATETAADNDAGPGSNVAAGAGLDWSRLAYELGLSGMAQQLVANSECVGYADSCIELRLPGELMELVNDLTRGEILHALQEKLGVSLRLQLSAAETLSELTPAQAKAERLRVERLAAIDAIREDTMVKKLQRAFAAELDEASVVKTESNR